MWAREWYAKSTYGSIGSEEAAVGAARTDADAHGPPAARAVPLIGGTVPVQVDARVDVAAGELHAQKSPARPGPVARLSSRRLAAEIHMFTGHGASPFGNEKTAKHTSPGGKICELAEPVQDEFTLILGGSRDVGPAYGSLDPVSLPR